MSSLTWVDSIRGTKPRLLVHNTSVFEDVVLHPTKTVAKSDARQYHRHSANLQEPTAVKQKKIVEPRPRTPREAVGCRQTIYAHIVITLENFRGRLLSAVFWRNE